MTENIRFINKKLETIYGKDVSVSQPRFRVVWSTDQYEIRDNPAGFDIYSESGSIFLRTEFGPHEVEKYALHQDMWVLEELSDAAAGMGILKVKWSYEPRWFFGLGTSNATPIWRAVDLLVKSIILARETKLDSPTTVLDNEEAKKAKEKILFKDILADASPYIPGCIHDGSAVVVPNKQFTEEVKTNG